MLRVFPAPLRALPQHHSLSDEIRGDTSSAGLTRVNYLPPRTQLRNLSGPSPTRSNRGRPPFASRSASNLVVCLNFDFFTSFKGWDAKTNENPVKAKDTSAEAEETPAKVEELPAKVEEASKQATSGEATISSTEGTTNQEVDLGFRRDLLSCYILPLPHLPPIGRGSYGVVTKVTSVESGEEFALKSIPKTPPNERERRNPESYLQKIVKEVQVMRHIGPSLDVVYLYDVFEDDTHVHLVLELCTGGELWSRIRTGTYSEAQAASVMRTIFRVIAQCHSKNVVYRDIKPDNFLFLTNKENSPLKATDFGLATYFTPGETLTRRCGTPSYIAPEVVGRKYTPAADCWSAGVTAYQLLTGRLPFRDRVNVRPAVKEVLRAVVDDPIDLESDPFPSLSEGARDLLRRLLDRNPETRLTAFEALHHPWVREGGNAPDAALDGSIVQRLQRFSTFTPLKRIVLQSIANHMLVNDARLLQAQELREIFMKFDGDKSGTLELDELKAGLDEAGYDLTERETKQLLTGMDIDRSGVIFYDEFLTALIDWRGIELDGEGKFKELVHQAFQTLEKDKEGNVKQSDIARLLCSAEDSDETCSVMMARALTGIELDASSVISEEEFWNLIHTSSADSLAHYADRRRCDEEQTDECDEEALLRYETFRNI